jgi:gluconate 2-dehydrogenase gamma chain
MMNRRDALWLLATGAALQLGPPKALAMMREARAVLGVQTSPRTLNAPQFATVKAMAEMILPRTETPGATDVGTGEFIDLMLTEWFEESERLRFINGLADVDARSQALFGKIFIECSALQQGVILTELGEAMIEDAEREHNPRNESTEPSENFYLTLRRLTLTAYYTSEPGATQELHFQIIPDRHDECADAPGGKETAESR